MFPRDTSGVAHSINVLEVLNFSFGNNHVSYDHTPRQTASAHIDIVSSALHGILVLFKHLFVDPIRQSTRLFRSSFEYCEKSHHAHLQIRSDCVFLY